MSFKKGDIVVVVNLKSYDYDPKFPNIKSGLQVYGKINMISEVTNMGKYGNSLCIKVELGSKSQSGRVEIAGVWGHEKSFRKATIKEAFLYYTHGQYVLRSEG